MPRLHRIGLEHRVVAEAAVTLRAVHYLALALAAGAQHRAVRHRAAYAAHEARAAVLLIAELIEQVVVPVRVGSVMSGAVARRVYARFAAQRVDYKSRIVRDRCAAERVGDGLGLEIGVLLKGRARLLDVEMQPPASLWLRSSISIPSTSCLNSRSLFLLLLASISLI